MAGDCIDAAEASEFFLADASKFWSLTDSKVFADMPMRHEHQMFIGGIPLFLGLLGLLIGGRAKKESTFAVMSGALGIVIAMTLYVGGAAFGIFFINSPWLLQYVR